MNMSASPNIGTRVRSIGVVSGIRAEIGRGTCLQTAGVCDTRIGSVDSVHHAELEERTPSFRQKIQEFGVEPSIDDLEAFYVELEDQLPRSNQAALPCEAQRKHRLKASTFWTREICI